MYTWIWRHLPGATPWRLAQSIALIALAVYALSTWLFPWMGTQIALDSGLTQ